MGVDLRPDLIGHREPNRRTELCVGHGARCGEPHQSDAEHRQGPTPVGVPTSTKDEPQSHETSTDHAGVPGGSAVEVGEEDQDATCPHATGRWTLHDAEQSEHAADGERNAPGEVLVVDERCRVQIDDHRPTQDCGDQHAVGSGFGSPEYCPPACDDPKPPEHQRTEQRGCQPGQQHGRSRECAVEPARDEENRHSENRRKDAEICVGLPVVQESFDTQTSIPHVQMAMEHRTSLVVVEEVVRSTSERVRRTRPEVPRHPQKDQARRRDPDEHGYGEVTTATREDGVVREPRLRLDVGRPRRFRGEGHGVRHGHVPLDLHALQTDGYSEDGAFAHRRCAWTTSRRRSRTSTSRRQAGGTVGNARSRHISLRPSL